MGQTALTVIWLRAQLHRRGAGQAVDAGLGRRVVALAEVAAQPGDRGHVDDAAAAALVLHHARRRLQAGEGAGQVDVEHRRPFLGRQLERGAVAQDARVVDQDVEAAERFDSGADDLLGGVEGADRPLLATASPPAALDLLDHAGRRRRCSPLPSRAHAGVVDDDLGAFLGEEQSVGATDAGAGAGDESDLAVEESHLTS